MHLGKSSLLLKRLICKKYKITYLEIFISILTKHGKKKYAKKIFFLIIVLLKKFLFKYIQKQKLKKLNNINFFNFFSQLLDSYRPKVLLINKKSAAQYRSIPWYINLTKSRVLLVRWLIQSAKKRIEKNFITCLYFELIDLFFFRGLTIKKLEEYYTIAVANRPFLRLLKKKRRVFSSRLKKFSK